MNYPYMEPMAQFKRVDNDLYKWVWYYGHPNWQFVRRLYP